MDGHEGKLTGENIICFAGEDWGTHNPFAKYHLMLRLSKDNRVLFVESVGLRKPQKTRKDFNRILSKVKKWAKGWIKVNNNFYVVSPLVLPYHSNKTISKINKILLLFQIKIYQAVLRFKNPILWICIPSVANIVDYLKSKRLIFHVFDRWEARGTLDSETSRQIKEWRSKLTKMADIVFVAGKMLYDESIKLNTNVHFVDHGVDFDHFGNALDLNGLIPLDAKNIKHPVVGYFGGFEEEIVDYNLIKYIANKRKDWSLVLLGDATHIKKHFEDYENVFFLGKKRYEELPNYAKVFDVCIIPFLINKWTEVASQPIKLREYLAAGKPVVSTLMPEDEKFQDVVRYSSDYDAFIKHIETSLVENTDVLIKKRRDKVRNETWDLKLNEITEIIISHLSSRLVGQNIICFANGNWGIYRPLAQHHIMERLAKKNKILFVESIGMRKPELSEKDFERVFVKIKKWLRGYVKINRNLFIVTPLAIPFYSNKYIDYINKILLIIQMRIYKYILGFNNPILWMCIPTATGVIGHLKEKILISHIFDRYEHVPNIDQKTKKYIRERMDYLIGRSNICFVAGLMILQDNQHLNRNIYFVDHGVDYELFSKALKESISLPQEIRSMKSPVIGYVGNIEKENVDYNLLRHIAQRHLEWNIVLVGKYHAKSKEFSQFPNIRLMGEVSYYELPNYLNVFDVCIIPFKISEWIKAVSQPLKLREYLAAGKPVVSTLMPEEEKFRSLVRYSDDYEEFMHFIEESLNDTSPGDVQKRRDSVKNETWDEKLNTIEQLISPIINGEMK